MTKVQESQMGSIAPMRELRAHPRRKLSGMAYVELAQDNGGILLNLSEGGLAIQCALAVTSNEFPGLRFQLPRMLGRLNASGRLAWISESKKEAGIAFVDLPEQARTQIRNWIANESKEARAYPKVETPALDANGKPVITASAKAKFDAVRANAAPSSQNPIAADAVPNAATAKSGNGATEPQSFTFNDYSMFSAASNLPDPTLWTQPRKRTSWGTVTLLCFLVAALFFALGATVRHENVNRLLAYVGTKTAGWRQTGEAPADTARQEQTGLPNSPEPEQNGVGEATANPTTAESNSGSEATADGSQQAGKTQNTQPGAGSQSASETANVPAVDQPQQPPSGREQDDTPAAQSKNPQAPVSAAISGNKNPYSLVHRGSSPKESKKLNAASRMETSARVTAEQFKQYAPAGAENGHFILVNAPAPGSPPMFVNLPSEPVSASATVAISARRSIEVPARAESAYGPERVNIGTLVAHSDPFYPAEARNKRMDGSVELEAVVGRTGQVISVQPISGPQTLASAAATALREWRYEPTYVNGDPVETRAHVIIVFRLP